jgi:hypothetical protein
MIVWFITGGLRRIQVLGVVAIVGQILHSFIYRQSRVVDGTNPIISNI